MFGGVLGARIRKRRVLIGTSLPIKAEGALIRRGINAAFFKENIAGGIDGKSLELLVREDRKSVTRAYENIQSLRSETNIFLNIFMPGVVGALLPDIIAEKLLVIGPESNASVLYKPEHKNLILTKPSVRSEIDALLDYAIVRKRRKKIAIFYVDDAGGESGRNIAREVLKKYDLEPVAEASHPRRTVAVGPAVRAIVPKQPEVILCIARRHATYSFVLNALNSGAVRTIFLGTSHLLPIQKQLKEARGIDFIATSLVPNPEKSRLSIVREYRRYLNQYYPEEPFSVISLASYINASILIQLMKQAKGDIAMDKIVAAAEGFKNFDLGGISLNFDSATRSLSQRIWLSLGHRKQWLDLTKKLTEKEVIATELQQAEIAPEAEPVVIEEPVEEQP